MARVGVQSRASSAPSRFYQHSREDCETCRLCHHITHIIRAKLMPSCETIPNRGACRVSTCRKTSSYIYNIISSTYHAASTSRAIGYTTTSRQRTCSSHAFLFNASPSHLLWSRSPSAPSTSAVFYQQEQRPLRQPPETTQRRTPVRVVNPNLPPANHRISIPRSSLIFRKHHRELPAMGLARKKSPLRIPLVRRICLVTRTDASNSSRMP